MELVVPCLHPVLEYGLEHHLAGLAGVENDAVDLCVVLRHKATVLHKEFLKTVTVSAVICIFGSLILPPWGQFRKMGKFLAH